jgi:glutathione synthase/RimK-type ligase-like ATP-grasp enzyme
MSNPPVTLITSSVLPKLDRDSGLIVAELSKLGLDAEVCAWDAPVDWTMRPLVVLVTPWDYVGRHDEFFRWVRRVDHETRLLNPRAVLEWNSHKGYLVELAERGVPVVPTRLIRQGATDGIEAAAFPEEYGELVVKPAVGSGARGAMKGRRDSAELRRHLAALVESGDALVQPFIPSVKEQGEVSLLYFGGRFSHALRKRPAAGDYRVQDHYGGTMHDHAPSEQERAVAEAALRVTPKPTFYARVDLVEIDGAPSIMELEVIEPELFLRLAPDAAARYAELIAAEYHRGA